MIIAVKLQPTANNYDECWQVKSARLPINARHKIFVHARVRGGTHNIHTPTQLSVGQGLPVMQLHTAVVLLFSVASLPHFPSRMPNHIHFMDNSILTIALLICMSCEPCDNLKATTWKQSFNIKNYFSGLGHNCSDVNHVFLSVVQQTYEQRNWESYY